MARKIDWNKKAVKLLSKYISEDRMDELGWYNDEETDREYILSWDDEGTRKYFIVNKDTLNVTFVN